MYEPKNKCLLYFLKRRSALSITCLKSLTKSTFLKSSDRCHYEVLGVNRKASQVEIKRAYYEKSKLLHPDASGSKEAFLELKRAYDVLSRPADRRCYDATGYYGSSTDPASRARARFYSQSFYNQDFNGQNWNTYYNRHYKTRNCTINTEREYRYFKCIMIFTACGFLFVLLYNFGYWWRLRNHQKYLKSLVDKDEIVRSFLRQREHRDKFRNEEELRQLGQKLWTNIDEAQRRRMEQMDRDKSFEIREEARWIDAVTNPVEPQRRFYSSHRANKPNSV